MQRNHLKTIYLLAAFCVSAILPAQTAAQIPQPPKPPKPSTVHTAPPSERFSTSEKSLAVDGKVSVSLCVLEGNLKINGWDRNEIRVFVQNGSRSEFQISQKNSADSPVWVRILRSDGANSARSSDCLRGDEIEIDAPRGASFVLKGQETETTIDSIRKASVKSIGGDILLNNISEGIEAQTYEGDITAENCGGAVNLESGTGNITVFEAVPSDIGDVFKAKTNNGRIVLQSIGHRQIEANSISGAIVFDGAPPSGGFYSFVTSNGSILMTMPPDSSCKITASYGFGAFDSEMPLRDLKKNVVSRVQNLTATLGTGESTVNLTTNSGRIRLRGKK